MQITLLIISILLFIFAPGAYSITFCMTCFGVFLTNACILSYRDYKQINTINFNLLFAIAFFLCSYSFACFILPAGEIGLIGTALSGTSINPCTALCTCAYSAYACGYGKLKRSNATSEFYSLEYVKQIIRKIKLFYLLLLVAVFLVLFLFIRTTHEIEIEVTSTPYLFVLFTVFTAMLFACIKYGSNENTSIIGFLQSNKIVIGGTVLVMLIYLFIGDRKLIIDLGLILLGTFSIFYKRIKPLVFAALLILGFVLMALVGLTRNSNSSLREGGLSSFVALGSTEMQSQESVWLLMSDLTERYEELYFGYEYTQKHGLQYPLKIIPFAFSPIPLLPNAFCQFIYDVPLSKTSPGLLVGKNMYSDHDTGAGTHCVVDAYMPWGMLGTLLLFFFFGKFVRYVSNNYNRNLLFSSMYLLLISQSVFLARGSLFDMYRMLAWCYISIYLIKKTSKALNEWT